MAFSSFSNAASPFGSVAGSGDTNLAPELAEISTEAIGFHALAGESKLRLVSGWPQENLPAPTSSLLSVASSKGLLAAAGPDSVIITSTDAVRQAFDGPKDVKFRSFDPQLTLKLGVRISQLSFSADEDFLALSAEAGGGLAIYEVSSLLKGITQPAFEVSTNGISLRALLPNPKSETAHLLAVVTVNGQLMIADLKSRQFLSGANGQVLKDNVSTASWSNKGKQIVAGLGNGSCIQMTPEGQVKAEIPVPPGLDGVQMVSSMNWLENDTFLIAHTPPAVDGSGMVPTTTYHIVNRAKASPTGFSFHKLPEISPPFGLPRAPAFQFINRLRRYPPSLEDVIAVVSTASIDIQVITRSSAPLSKDFPEAQLINTYTSTQPADDAKRASLPMTEGLNDTSPIGMAFDLSSKDKVKKPIPGEEFEESPHPLPALFVLNNEGILAAWWFVYADSIRQGTIYPGLTIAEGANANSGFSRQDATPSKPTQALGSAFGQSAFGKPATPTASFGSSSNPSAAPAFGGSGNIGSAFGAPSGLGVKSSPWGASAAAPQNGSGFGQPSFGTPSQIGGASQGPAFGSTAGLGNRSSPWGAASTAPTSSGAAFGQTGMLGGSGSAFGVPSPSGTPSQTTAPTSGGFASFATKSGFAAAPASSGTNLFSKPAASSPFVAQTQSTAFGQPDNHQTPNPFNKGAFTLGSTFQRDSSAVTEPPKASDTSTPSLFGGGFGSALGEAAATQTKDADMSDGQDEPTPTAAKSKEAEGPKPPIVDSKSSNAPSFPPTGSSQLFGKSPEAADRVERPHENQSTGFSFGSTAPDHKAKDESKGKDERDTAIPQSPNIKVEPVSDDALSDNDSISSLNDDEAKPPEGFAEHEQRRPEQTDEAPETPARSPSSPLPPESTSKTAYAAGDSSNSSKISDDAPPPAAATPNKSSESDDSDRNQTRLPEDSGVENESFEEEDSGDAEHSGVLDDEGSGVDVGQELSPASSKNSSKATPGSSFGPTQSKAPATSFFSPEQSSSSSSKPQQTSSLFGPSANIPLFGESGKPSIPLFASQKTQGSPRSPSPIRKEQNLGTFRPESSRSVTAPNVMSGQDKASSRPQQSLAPAVSPLSARDIRNKERGNLAAARNIHNEQQIQVLSDDEDDYNQVILKSDVEASKTLDKFIAHQDYISAEVKPGISGQIEKVFRDINSMIDTLGLNSRSLVAFTKGHEIESASEDREPKNLDRLEEWCLVDVADLSSREDELQSQLQQQRVQATQEKLANIQKDREKLSNIRRQTMDIGRTINNSRAPAASGASNQKPLNLDQQTQLNDLRKNFAEFQKQLADAEQGLVLLRTRLSPQANGAGSNGKPKLKQPTVEAVEKTIRKMTSLVSQKNEDIDDLASKLGDLRMQSPASNLLEDSELRGSRQGSPATSSPFFRSSQRNSRPSSRRNGYDPQQSISAYQQSPLRGSQISAGGATGAGDFFTHEEKKVQRARAKTRREINDAVKEVFGGSELRVHGLD